MGQVEIPVGAVEHKDVEVRSRSMTPTRSLSSATVVAVMVLIGGWSNVTWQYLELRLLALRGDWFVVVNSPIHYPAHDERASLAAPFRASIARTEFSNAFAKTPLPTVSRTRPRNRPLRFLPSRMTTTSMSVKPSGRRVKV